ncbi:MAG: hypothetical protein RLP09_17395 [Sandaracinaceae bacterium]
MRAARVSADVRGRGPAPTFAHRSPRCDTSRWRDARVPDRFEPAPHASRRSWVPEIIGGPGEAGVGLRWRF